MSQKHLKKKYCEVGSCYSALVKKINFETVCVWPGEGPGRQSLQEPSGAGDVFGEHAVLLDVPAAGVFR